MHPRACVLSLCNDLVWHLVENYVSTRSRSLAPLRVQCVEHIVVVAIAVIVVVVVFVIVEDLAERERKRNGFMHTSAAMSMSSRQSNEIK